mmetsp:Transcript_20025/g.51302  ORF Transcript_20025/g.51302 Transcript_20025/m.51302 type:complete len:210 (+) Transcript_20025:392-1021(+)
MTSTPSLAAALSLAWPGLVPATTRSVLPVTADTRRPPNRSTSCCTPLRVSPPRPSILPVTTNDRPAKGAAAASPSWPRPNSPSALSSTAEAEGGRSTRSSPGAAAVVGGDGGGATTSSACSRASSRWLDSFAIHCTTLAAMCGPKPGIPRRSSSLAAASRASELPCACASRSAAFGPTSGIASATSSVCSGSPLAPAMAATCAAARVAW